MLENRIGFYLRIGFPQSLFYLHVIKIFQTFFYLAQRKKKEKLFLKIMFILTYLHVNFSHIFSIELRLHSTYSVFNLERYVNEYKMCVLSRRRKRYKNVERKGPETTLTSTYCLAIKLLNKIRFK